MMRTLLLDILAEHADALNRGDDLSPGLLARYPEAAAELEPLLLLARAVKSVLVPVKPTDAFLARLQDDLESGGRRRAYLPRLPQRLLVGLVAGLGSLLSVVGLVWVIRQRRVGRPASPSAI